MKDERIAVRLEDNIKAALKQAADADKRPISTFVALIVTEWLKAKGFLR